jgi:hypothetical protein
VGSLILFGANAMRNCCQIVDHSVTIVIRCANRVHRSSKSNPSSEYHQQGASHPLNRVPGTKRIECLAPKNARSFGACFQDAVGAIFLSDQVAFVGTMWCQARGWGDFFERSSRVAPKKLVPGTRKSRVVPGTMCAWHHVGWGRGEVLANWGGDVLGLLIEFAVASKVIWGEGSREGKLHSLIGWGLGGEVILGGFVSERSHETDYTPSGESAQQGCPAIPPGNQDL